MGAASSAASAFSSSSAAASKGPLACRRSSGRRCVRSLRPVRRCRPPWSARSRVREQVQRGLTQQATGSRLPSSHAASLVRSSGTRAVMSAVTSTRYRDVTSRHHCGGGHPDPGEVLVREGSGRQPNGPEDPQRREEPNLTGRKSPRGSGARLRRASWVAVGDGVTRLAASATSTSARRGREPEGRRSIRRRRSRRRREGGRDEAGDPLLGRGGRRHPVVGLTAFQAVIGTGNLHAGQPVSIHGCLGGKLLAAPPPSSPWRAAPRWRTALLESATAHEARDRYHPDRGFRLRRDESREAIRRRVRHRRHAVDRRGPGVAQAGWLHHLHQPRAGEVHEQRLAGAGIGRRSGNPSSQTSITTLTEL